MCPKRTEAESCSNSPILAASHRREIKQRGDPHDYACRTLSAPFTRSCTHVSPTAWPKRETAPLRRRKCKVQRLLRLLRHYGHAVGCHTVFDFLQAALKLSLFIDTELSERRIYLGHLIKGRSVAKVLG